MAEFKSLLPDTDALSFNELKMCRTGPLLYNKYDIYVGGSLKKYGEFSVGEQNLFQRIVLPGHFIVEVGANIGAHTVELSRLAGPGGAVYAFEPQRIVFQTLCANLALNQCTNVRAWQAAVGSEPANIMVPALDPSIRTNFGGVSMYGVESGEPVPLITLDDIDLPACHFLKVDVEGMEVEVLKGAQKTIESYRPVMYLENDRDESSEELLSLVLEMDYSIHWHTPHLYNPDNFAGDRENIFPEIVSVNVLCTPAEAGIEVQGMRQVLAATDKWRG